MTDVDHLSDGHERETDEPLRDRLDVHVGGRIRLRRSVMGMTQTALAERLGLTFQQVQKYERGTNRVAASRLYRIAVILEVPLSFFFDDAIHSAPKENPVDIAKASGLYRSDRALDTIVDAGLFDRETAELLRAYYRIGNVSVRRHLLSLIKSMHDDDTGTPIPTG